MSATKNNQMTWFCKFTPKTRWYNYIEIGDFLFKCGNSGISYWLKKTKNIWMDWIEI